MTHDCVCDRDITEQAELKRCTEISVWGAGRLSTVPPVLTHLFLTLNKVSAVISILTRVRN